MAAMTTAQREAQGQSMQGSTDSSMSSLLDSAFADMGVGDEGAEGEEVADPDIGDEDAPEGEAADGDGDGDADATDDAAGEESEGEDAPAAKGKAKAEDTEEIEVTDHEGRRTIKIDYTDRPSIKRAFQQAAGARKLHKKYSDVRTDRDSIQATLAELKPKAEDAIGKLTTFDDLYERGGVRALVERVEGKRWDEVVRAERAKDERVAAMSPDERAAYERQQLARDKDREIEGYKNDLKKVTDLANKQVEDATLSRLETMTHTLFDQHRFQGKLGDEVREHKLDAILWNHVQSELTRLESAKTELSRAVVLEVIREAAADLSLTIDTQAGRKAAKEVEQKKVRAAKAVQGAVIKGSRQLASQVGGQDTDFDSSSSVASWMESRLRKKSRS